MQQVAQFSRLQSAPADTEITSCGGVSQGEKGPMAIGGGGLKLNADSTLSLLMQMQSAKSVKSPKSVPEPS